MDGGKEELFGGKAWQTLLSQIKVNITTISQVDSLCP